MDLHVSAVMKKEVVSVDPSTTLADLETLFLRHNVSGFPVVANDKLVGVVSTTDVIRAVCPNVDITSLRCLPDEIGRAFTDSLGSAEAKMTVADVMSAEVVSVRPQDYLHAAADLMYQKKIHRIFAVEDNTLMGVVTPFDFVRLYSNDRIGVEVKPVKVDF